MKKCPQCGANQQNEAARCSSCGFSFASAKESEPADNDKLEFVVTEKDNDDREFVGGTKDFEHEDDIQLESPEEILEKEATAKLDDDSEDTALFQNGITPLGQSEPPLPPIPEDSPSPADFSSVNPETPSPEDTSKTSTDRIKKLSDEEVKEIERNLYRKSSYLDEKEKQTLIQKLDAVNQPFGNTPISPHKSEDSTPPPVPPLSPDDKSDNLTPPKLSERERGIAYYYKNYIQLTTSKKLHPEEELKVGELTFELRPKRINPKMIFGAAAVLFALILIAIGSLFITDTTGDNGKIIGIVLDENGVPFIRGATINFPTINKSVKSNSQGFFKSEDLPAGTYKIELVYDGEVIGTDYATVVGGKVSTVSLSPEWAESQAPPQIAQTSSSSSPPTATSKQTNQPANNTKATTKTTSGKKESKKSSSRKKTKSTKKSPAKLTLAANVEGARLKLNSSVMGAGNLTYKGLKPKKYKYEVTKDGYEPATGYITLKSGKTSKLVVELTPLPRQVKEKTYQADDFYYSGLTAYQNGQYLQAIDDLTQAVEKKPSYAEAYMTRGESYASLKDWTPAHDDFIRAAEIFQINKDYSRAITAYNRALDVNKKSVTAYLGRGKLFMLTHEDRAAILDFETVLKYDKRNMQAYFGLGEARFRQGYYKKAIKSFKNARSIDSKNPLIQQYLMLCYMAVDDFKNVKKSYKRFLEIANDKDVERLHNDPRYSAVLRIAENDN